MPVRNHFRMRLMRRPAVLLYNRITVTFGRSTAYELGHIFLCLVYGFYILTTRVVTAGLYLSSKKKIGKIDAIFLSFGSLFWLHVYWSAHAQWKKYSPLTHRRIFTDYCGLSALFITNTYKFQFDLIQEVFVHEELCVTRLSP